MAKAARGVALVALALFAYEELPSQPAHACIAVDINMLAGKPVYRPLNARRWRSNKIEGGGAWAS